MKRFFVIIAIVLLTLVVASQANAQGRGRGDERRITTPSGEFGRNATSGGDRRVSGKEERKNAVVGTIVSIDSATGTFTLSTRKGTKTIQTSATTVFKEKSNVTISFSDLLVSDFVGVVGQQTAQDTITASRVIKVPKEDNSALKELKRRAVYGVVSAKEATAGGTLLTLAHPKRQTTTQLLVTSETKITKKGMESTTINDILVNDRVTAVGTRNDQNLLVAKILHAIPGLARGLFGTQPTPSTGEAATPTLPPITNTPVPPTETPTP